MNEKQNDNIAAVPDELNELLQKIVWNEAGLVPAVIQDAVSKEVLMLAYMNRESLLQSQKLGEAVYWSRSRQELWYKGATSGHIQKIRSLHYDCDADTLLIRVDQQGAACHTGQYSCFSHEADLFRAEPVASNSDRFAALNQLEQTISQRYAERPEGAYTSYLFNKGVDKMLKKVGEEAAEVIIAAKNNDNDELRRETSDLIFHLMVLLRERGLPLDDIMRELNNRHGQPTTNSMR